ncbi:hypothetical protein [Exiguobacterium sp. s189]|uniref:rolling circle replication-associated protein n=1 Tax=Exiguobacterium sp. s189 TaxID=2751263 RepID=UPI001BE56F58|nr:hypothetical protein [Exiguobacterium sp. s189]
MEEESRPAISPISSVRVTKMNHLVEVQHMEFMNRTNHIKKLDKERYVNLKTGEIGEFNHSEVRSDSFNSLRQTFKKLRYLINNNYTGVGNELHITLTYEENMRDTKKLYSDFDKFMKRFRYKYSKQYGSIDYMTVVEPQERGAWHHHLLIRFNDMKGKKIFIPNNEVCEIWGHGFTNIHSLKGVDNIGAYLSAYLTDVEVNSTNVHQVIADKRELKIVEVDGQEKKFIKGGRLHLYPSGMNLYRKSKGIQMPERQEMKYQDIKKVVGSTTPNYTKQIVVEQDDFTNTITYEQYNMKRGEQ